MPELASCRDVSKSYRSSAGLVEALHGVDASFAAGGITAVVGPSGSGKSTLLRILAGLERPSGGEVTACGRELTHLDGRGLRRYRRDAVAFVSQSPADNFLPQLTLAEHAGTAGAALLARFGVAHRLGEQPRALSGGEQARAAFALALLRETPLVVADEPTAELDEESAARLLDALRDSAAAGRAFVIATHDVDVVAIADSVIRLERGRVAPERADTRGPSVTAPTTTAAETVLEAEALTRSFGPVRAVDGASLRLGRGELAVLVGRSGSGKSTLMNLLGGWQRPDSGRVDPQPETLDWADLAFLPQRFGLLDELTVRGNVELAARVRGTLADDSERIDRLLDRLGLDELADRLPRETSIGQQQRTALARALALRPGILLADEPTSHQDAAWHDTVVSVLLEEAAAGTSCLIATHEEDLARRGNTTWELHEGRTRRRTLSTGPIE